MTLLPAFFVAGAVLADEPARSIDYTADVAPIFREHCSGCHGADARESGLRLDSPGFLARGGDRGAAFVPGQSDKSLLFKAIVGEGDVAPMPADGPRLSAEEIQLIKSWIDSGARLPESDVTVDDEVQSDHWAFQPIRRPRIPEVQNRQWLRTPIDAFILARIEAEGLEPASEADRSTLIRRLSLDLRGLPPAIEEIDAFLNDDRPDAYERLVDRLLDSPHYGERWGRHWLDVARYADSNGFTIDSPRSIWKYRDWVIDALNRDLPFDEFTTAQLAGDMRPDAATDELVATGFHRNTLINEEGGTDDEQFRVESIIDRVNTTGTVFLGLTVGCAQCHAHKYDPISQREYYELFAIFNNCQEPTLPVPSPSQEKRMQQIDAQIAAIEKPLREHDQQFQSGLPEWEKRILAEPAGSWMPLRPASFRTERGAVLTELDDGSLVVDFSVPANDTYIVDVDIPLDEITAVRLEALTHSSLPDNGPGRGEQGNFVLSEIELHAAPLEPPGDAAAEPQPIKIAQSVADHSQDGFPLAYAWDGNLQTGWAIGTGTGTGSPNVDREAILFPTEPIRCSGGARLTVTLRQNHSKENYLLGRFRLSASQAAAESLQVPANIRKIAATPADERTDAQKSELKAAYKQTDTQRAPLARQLDDLRQQKQQLENTIPTTMVLRELAEPRTTHIHIRGDFLRQGAAVTGAVPAVLPALPKQAEYATRLDLARWLVDPENPLTARVTVNRFWQRFFGTGLVRTENDFGTQGSSPTHPELLDWLAGEFIRSGWSIKSINRLIVTSAVYRQSSRFRPELAQRDPANRLLARQSRLRLEAEIVRDACLAASGLFCKKIGGPSVYPPQPEGIYVLTQQKKNWPVSTGSDRHRRGMYTFFWRSSPYPLMPTFDAPDANTTCTNRNRSNTPLQALTLANDLSFVEIAQGLAARILREAPSGHTDRVDFAFHVCLGREPSAAERERLLRFVLEQQAEFEESAEAATSAAAADRPDHVSLAEAAAWTAAARVLFNVDEMITRE